MKVSVLYFAQARDALGRARDSVEVPRGATASQLLDEVSRGNPALASLRGSIRVSVNSEVVPPDRRLEEGDEVAVLPPVAGG